MSRDQLAFRFGVALFAILTLYGIGMLLTVLFGNATLAARLVSGFASMFAGILGFGTGYLLGRRNGQ